MKCIECNGKGDVPVQDYRTAAPSEKPIVDTKPKEPRKTMDNRTKTMIDVGALTVVVVAAILLAGAFARQMFFDMELASVFAILVFIVGSLDVIASWARWE